jgi:hypothetical protein
MYRSTAVLILSLTTGRYSLAEPTVASVTELVEQRGQFRSPVAGTSLVSGVVLQWPTFGWPPHLLRGTCSSSAG